MVCAELWNIARDRENRIHFRRPIFLEAYDPTDLDEYGYTRYENVLDEHGA